MALNTIETIKNAELSASEQIDKAEKSAKENLQKAELKAKEMLANALEDSKNMYEHKVDKANKKADEIIVSQINSAKLNVDKLKSEALNKQDVVNSEILKIII